MNPDQVKIEPCGAILAAMQFPKFEIFITVAPLVRTDGIAEYITPEEGGETAKLIEETRQSKKNPDLIKAIDPESTDNEKLQETDSLEAPNMVKYRNQNQRYQVITEMEK